MNMMAGLGLNLNRRETTCLTVAFVLHALLFLWKGGMLTLPATGGVPLGDPLLQVGYMSDVPEYMEQGAPGEEGKKRGIMGAVKKFFGGTGSNKPAAKPAPELAGGSAAIDQKIADTGPKWDKATSQLTDKAFSNKRDFAGIQNKKDFAVASGNPTNDIIEQKSVGTVDTAAPNLKERNFKIAKRDAPFKIASAKEMDSLANVNMVPVDMGDKTSPSMKSLEAPGSAGVMGGAALKSKSIGGGSSSGGFSGMSGGSGSGKGKSGSTGGGDSLAMGGAGAAGGGMIDAGGMGSGLAGSGTGGGGSTPGGQGRGAGGGGGRGGGSPFGTIGGTGGGSAGMLPRRQLGVQGTVSNSSTNDSMITGELARRPVREKFRPPYEMDARVAIRFRVNSNGKVLDGAVIEVSSGSPSFDNRVIEALKKWLFVALPGDQANVVQEGVITFVFRGE